MMAVVQAEFEVIARGFYLEALLIDGDDVWFSDVATGGVRCVGSEKILRPERTMIGGLLLNADGSILIGGPRGIVWENPRSGKTGVLIDGLNGTNEMRADHSGGIVFGTTDLPSILRGERPGPSAIYALSATRRLTKLREGLAFANGLSFSADGSELYFNESFAASRVFEVGKDGSLAEPRVLAAQPDCDGLALDADGNVWISGFSSGHLLCLTPGGDEVRRLALPGKACTNVRFGGEDMQDLFATIVEPAAAQRLADGEPLIERNSVLIKMRSPVPGAPIARSNFKFTASESRFV